MHDDQKRGPLAAPLLAGAALLILLPLLYILSCGPAVALMTRGYLSREAFDIAYHPLRLASQSSTWMGQALEWYAQLWAA
ncbi:MAG: hypothetical protein ACR2FY_12790 [Pirellulaceae bacterium]